MEQPSSNDGLIYRYSQSDDGIWYYHEHRLQVINVCYHPLSYYVIPSFHVGNYHRMVNGCHVCVG
jgi:hypothetical protein